MTPRPPAAPQIRTRSVGPSRPRVKSIRYEMAAMPTVAASSQLRLRGLRVSMLALTTVNCANVPSGVSYPFALSCRHASGSPPLHSSHSPHVAAQRTLTWSPGRHLRTETPQRQTIPLASEPAT
jgi:hypothetical protein